MLLNLLRHLNNAFVATSVSSDILSITSKLYTLNFQMNVLYFILTRKGICSLDFLNYFPFQLSSFVANGACVNNEDIHIIVKYFAIFKLHVYIKH